MGWARNGRRVTRARAQKLDSFRETDTVVPNAEGDQVVSSYKKPPPIPRRPLLTPPAPPPDPAYASRLTATIGRLEAHLERLEIRLDAQSENIRALGLAERELATTKKLAGAALALLIPVLVGGIVQTVRSDERQLAVESRVSSVAIQVDRAERSASELGAQVRVLAAETARQRETTDRLLDTIDRLENPRRNR